MLYSLNHHPTCRFEVRQALLYQLVSGLTDENGKYNYAMAVHFYPPFFDIFCSAKNYKIALALTDGNTFSEFRKNMNDFLKGEGYEGLDPLQADLIFRTNIQTAYNVGHYEQMTDPGVMKLRPYWQYDAVNDTHTRPSHLAMDGKVFPADHPVWNTWFPPNGFRCRCTVRTLSKRQVEARELTVEDEFPAIAPDPHFGTNPAKVKFSPDMKGYPDALVKAYQNREKENPSP